MIYIIVKVTYDYYRFQENIGATTDHGEAIRIAEEFIAELPRGYDYEIIEDETKSDDCHAGERSHIWIQQFDPTKKA